MFLTKDEGSQYITIWEYEPKLLNGKWQNGGSNMLISAKWCDDRCRTVPIEAELIIK